MNEELQKEILEIVKGTKDFVVTQAPDSIQQLLQYEYMSSIGWGGVCIIGLILFNIILVVSLLQKDRWTGWEPFKMISPVVSFLLFICMVCNYVTAYQIKHYPKGYLLKQVLRGGCK